MLKLFLDSTYDAVSIIFQCDIRYSKSCWEKISKTLLRMS